jgi:hypothetical protein
MVNRKNEYGTKKMMTVDSLKEKLGIKEDRALADVLGKTPGAISNWRKTGIPAKAEREALELMRERGIVSEQATPYENDGHQIPPDFANEIELWNKFDEVEQAMFRKLLKIVEGMDEEQRYIWWREQMKATKKGE